MKLFLRYIVFDVLKIYFVALLLLTAILVLVIVVDEAISLGLPLVHAIWLVPYTLPEQLRISIPMTLLLATTVSFSRMAGNNEIIATKALGIAPWQLMWPVWVLALFFSLACVWLNDFAVTWGRSGMTNIVYYALEDTIYSKLGKDGNVEERLGDDTYKISVARIEGKKLILPEITSEKKQSTMKMDEAEIQVDCEKGIVTILFTNLIGQIGNENVHFRENKIDIPIPIKNAANIDSKSPSEVPLNEIKHQVKKCENNIAKAQRTMATMAAFSLVTGDTDFSNQEVWANHESQVNNATKRLQRLNTEPARRWANGFSCFFFVWVGVPLAIRLQRADVFSSFFACFLPILILYYPCLMFGVNRAKEGSLPPSFVWVGNVCLAIVGYWFIKQIHKN